jgi:hypothetical protein
MNDDWPPPCRRYFHLLRENLLLLLARRVVIIIIETDLAHREHIRVDEKTVQFLEGCLVGKLSLVGVDAGGGQNPGYPRFAGVAFAQLQRLLHGIRSISDANGQNRAHSLLPGSLQQFLPVRVVSGAIQMCV